jgi:hypothetical protein
MGSIRISAPTAAAASALVDLLDEHRATAAQDSDGAWQVDVPLDGTARSTIPLTLTTTRAWLEQHGLRSTSITLDGNTHLLRSDGPSPLAMH